MYEAIFRICSYLRKMENSEIDMKNLKSVWKNLKLFYKILNLIWRFQNQISRTSCVLLHVAEIKVFFISNAITAQYLSFLEQL